MNLRLSADKGYLQQVQRIDIIYNKVYKYRSKYIVSMADNFLERHREQYEARKAAWLRKKKHLPKLKAKAAFQRPDDEAL